ncbi:glycoside hydrolase family 68 protein [Sphingomonas sp. Ant20]|uniref:glycoside hydrolase family 68 protein n=1 Tax=Sphingomonas sp. Ant20 TaxID=104605 RepID=UPI002741F6F9|nr:glycoside hydrolase family 68 protein [Sphingomonas sp. Ant20]
MLEPSEQVMTTPSRWKAADILTITKATSQSAPVIGPSEVVPVLNGYGFWDAWPVQSTDGAVYRTTDGVEIWMALGTPLFDNPDDRHSHARIHVIHRDDSGWRHVGPALPDGFAPGSREWSGTAVIDDAKRNVTLFFTAAGRRGEAETTFEQRLFAADSTLEEGGSLVDWRNLRELVQRDPEHYMPTTGGTGKVGTIKAFRDPAFFRDPADATDYFLFAASAAGSSSAYNGVIAIARAVGNDWELLPPIVTADGVNNELERPHVSIATGSTTCSG